MLKKNLIYWDTTQYPIDYPKIVKEIYYNQNIKNRKYFTSWVGNLGKDFSNDIDWWSTAPVSRNPYASNLFHYICVIKTIEKLSKKFKKFEIVVNSFFLKSIILKNFNSNNIFVKINKQNSKLKKYSNIFKAIFFSTFLFFFINFFIKKKNLKKNSNKKVLIDTFTFGDMSEGERLYKIIDEHLKRKKQDLVYFVPSFIPTKNFLEVIKAIFNLSKKNYVFKEHHLGFFDLIYAFGHIFRLKKFNIKLNNYGNIDLSNLVIQEIKDCKYYYSTILSLLNYRFARSIKNQKIELNKSIDWFENQTVDKGWNFGFRKYFPNIKIIGYQGFLYYGQYFNTIPSKEEEKAKVIPKEVIVISKSFIKKKKEFFPKLKVKAGPVLSYSLCYLDKNFKKTYKIKVLLILSGILSLDKKLLEWISYFFKKDKNINIFIKTHPILPLEKIDKNFLVNYKKRISVSNKPLGDLLKKTYISICSGPTSGTLESISYDCFLVCPMLEPYDKINLVANNIPKKNYKLVNSKEDFVNTVSDLAMKKKLSIKKKNILLEKNSYNNIEDFLN